MRGFLLSFGLIVGLLAYVFGIKISDDQGLFYLFYSFPTNVLVGANGYVNGLLKLSYIGVVFGTQTTS